MDSLKQWCFMQVRREWQRYTQVSRALIIRMYSPGYGWSEIDHIANVDRALSGRKQGWYYRHRPAEPIMHSEIWCGGEKTTSILDDREKPMYGWCKFISVNLTVPRTADSQNRTSQNVWTDTDHDVLYVNSFSGDIELMSCAHLGGYEKNLKFD